MGLEDKKKIRIYKNFYKKLDLIILSHVCFPIQEDQKNIFLKYLLFWFISGKWIKLCPKAFLKLLQTKSLIKDVEFWQENANALHITHHLEVTGLQDAPWLGGVLLLRVDLAPVDLLHQPDVVRLLLLEDHQLLVEVLSLQLTDVLWSEILLQLDHHHAFLLQVEILLSWYPVVWNKMTSASDESVSKSHLSSRLWSAAAWNVIPDCSGRSSGPLLPPSSHLSLARDQ